MIKLLGSALILGGFSAAWLSELRRWRRELESLNDLVAVLEELSNGVRLTRTPLPRLFRRLGQTRPGAVGDWLMEMSGALERGEGIRPVWANACKALPLEEGIQKTVGELGYKLSGDEQQICKAISLVGIQLTRELEEKCRRKRDWERQLTALCFSGAALLIILLL